MLAGCVRQVDQQAAAEKLLRSLLLAASHADAPQQAVFATSVQQLWSWTLCRCSLVPMFAQPVMPEFVRIQPAEEDIVECSESCDA